jgi:hypothetical protein
LAAAKKKLPLADREALVNEAGNDAWPLIDPVSLGDWLLKRFELPGRAVSDGIVVPVHSTASAYSCPAFFVNEAVRLG